VRLSELWHDDIEEQVHRRDLPHGTGMSTGRREHNLKAAAEHYEEAAILLAQKATPT
jgi:hypothetical protein